MPLCIAYELVSRTSQITVRLLLVDSSRTSAAGAVAFSRKRTTVASLLAEPP